MYLIQSRFSKTSKWLMLTMAGLLLAACGSDSRDPILGSGGDAALAPTVVMVTPADMSIDVSVHTNEISAQFSEVISPLSSSDFTVHCDLPCTDPTGTVVMSANNTIATYTIDSPNQLDEFTVYKATIHRATSNSTGLALERPYNWEFTTGETPDTTMPTVVITQPFTSTTTPTSDVPINTAISAVFSEPMLASTFNPDSFTVTCAAPCISPEGTVTYEDETRSVAFIPATNLQFDTTYTATISSSVTDPSGNPLAGNQGDLNTESDYTWQFSTGVAPDTTRPRVSVTQPLTTSPDPVTNVPVNTTVSAVFDKEMLATTFNSASFTVTCETPCVSPGGTVSYETETQSAAFNPNEDLEFETTYTATISSSVTDLAGNNLAGNQGDADTASDYIWQFTTGIMPDTTRPRVANTMPVTSSPGPTTNVPVNSSITAVFNEDMLATTISSNSFEVSCEAPCTSPVGEISYVVASRSAVFTPSQELEEGITYTATVHSTVTDLAGNRLAGNQGTATEISDYVWSFVTTQPAPVNDITVQSTAPESNGLLAVCPNATINATFDIPSNVRMDPTTVNSMTFLLVVDGDPLSSALPAESIRLDEDTGTIATFIPRDELTENVQYRATIIGGSDGVKDLMNPGNEMFEDYTWVFSATSPTESCLVAPELNSAAPFGGFGGSAGITNQGVSTIVNGDLGTTGASTVITGFVSEPGCEYTITTLNEGQVNGKIYTAPPPPTVECPQDGTAETEAIATQARLDAEAAYQEISPANLPGGQDPGNDNLGSLTLEPGVYTAQSGAFRIQGGDLTLDAQGNQNAVWVFQMATTLTVGGPGADFPQSVTLINGAQAKNVFWQVGSSATINAAGGGIMKGTIIAQSGVSISTAGNVNIVTLDGRALSLTASVTMVNTVINVPAQ